jgi:hypothetical protein
MSRSTMSLTLNKADWELIMSCLSSDDIEQVSLIKKIGDKMSRSNHEQPEASVLSPMEFVGIKGKMICVSSKDREPIEQLLPVLHGNILIFTSFAPNFEGIHRASKKGHDKHIVMKKIQELVMVQLLLKRKDLTENLDAIIVDRVDEIDNKKNKMQKGAIQAGMLAVLPSLIGNANVYFTTMLGIQGLYDRVDLHKVV